MEQPNIAERARQDVTGLKIRRFSGGVNGFLPLNLPRGKVGDWTANDLHSAQRPGRARA